MLNLVPFAGSGRKMTDLNRPADLVGQALEFDLPKPHARTIASSSIGGNEQTFGLGIRGLPHGLPPAPDAGDGKSRGIVIGSDTHPGVILLQVVNSIRGHSAQLR